MVAQRDVCRTVTGMNDEQDQPTLLSQRTGSEEELPWSVALRAVWSGDAPPEAFVLKVIWPYEVMDQNRLND